MSSDGGSDPHTEGRSGRPKILQRSSSSSWTQRTPAGLPSGMPGIGLLIDGAMQQAAQEGRQFMGELHCRPALPWKAPTRSAGQAPEEVTYPQPRVKSCPSLI